MLSNIFDLSSLKATQTFVALFANHFVVIPGNEFCSWRIIGIFFLYADATNRGSADA